MVDKLTPKKRSWNMSRIRSINTSPEKIVRSLLHRKGYRFSLHRKNLPGKPDIVMPRHKTIIFVHGCFWHQHRGCKRSNMPKSNIGYWKGKLKQNVIRDSKRKQKLKSLGWKIITIWECETENPKKSILKLKRKLLL